MPGPRFLLPIHLSHAMRDVLFPPHCMCCDGPLAPGEAVDSPCEECMHGVWPIDCATCDRCGFLLPAVVSDIPALCGRCLAHPPAYHHASSAFVHGGPIAQSILRLKHGQAQNARALLQLADTHDRLPRPAENTRIIPIPLHSRRRRKRGYNQAFLLARALTQRLGCERPLRALVRTRDTVLQPGLSPSQRRRNVKSAFRARRSLTGIHALLIDDVLTTGATLDAAATTLLSAGCLSVDAWTLSRASGSVP
jgi:ComF family protein